tara:strand:- start:1099 stop:1296 length:198 start_codon:yes stop_codon:yes gene_type:complete
LQGLVDATPHLSAFLSAFSHITSWKWLDQSPKFPLQKGNNTHKCGIFIIIQKKFYKNQAKVFGFK